MYCNFNYGNYCGNCTKFVKTTEIKGTAERLDLIIPAQSLCNCTTLCICVAQPIPAEVTEDSQVYILVGDTEYPTVTPCLNFIYGDQIRACKMYCFKFATDTLGFIYKGGWRLGRTKHAFTCIPLPAPAAKAKKIESKKKEKVEEEE